MSSPADIKLYYFNIDGGRGLAARIALDIGGVPHEDVRVAGAQWMELKASAAPYGTLPFLEITKNGKTTKLAESVSVTHYCGQLAGLVGGDDLLQQARVLEVIAQVEAWNGAMGPSFKEKDPEKKLAMRAAMVSGPLPGMLKHMDARIAGSTHCVGDSLTVADLHLMGILRMLSSGIMDGIPKDIVAAYPNLVKFLEATLANEGVKAYFAKREATKKAAA